MMLRCYLAGISTRLPLTHPGTNLWKIAHDYPNQEECLDEQCCTIVLLSIGYEGFGVMTGG